MAKPITPDEATRIVPDTVIEVFNELIREKIHNKTALIKQDEVVVRVCERTGVERHTIFQNGWLDVEPIFRAAGWHVEFEKADYTGLSESFFTFKKP